MQDAIRRLTDFWSSQGCAILQPFNTEVGAGTMNPGTFLRVLGPEPWKAAYVEPSVRPDDSRYGNNPNRLQTHTQFQVILKPEPGNPQDLLIASLEELEIDTAANDVRFVEDNWAQPAIGAWGLGWEVWLNGLEITQFTYFQQVAGVELSPIPVEITYGLERILMAAQGISHFKDILVTDDMTYGDMYADTEYEMSRYYLDEADVQTNQVLLELYVAEATRLIEASLPLPAYSYVLKSSHAFNVLDSRGAISPTERVQMFSTIRGLAGSAARAWIEKRRESGFPLLRSETPQRTSVAAPENASQEHQHAAEAETEPAIDAADSSQPASALLEIGFEELPPAVALETPVALAERVKALLSETGLDYGELHLYSTPRRAAVLINDVLAREKDRSVHEFGPTWASAFDDQGAPTKAMSGFLRSKEASIDDIVKVRHRDRDVVAVERTIVGRDASRVLTDVFSCCISSLTSARNMRWSDPELSFSRPIRWVTAMHGSACVELSVAGLDSSQYSRVLRSDPASPVRLTSADAYEKTLRKHSIVPDTAERKQNILAGATQLAEDIGGQVVVDDDLADELSQLVEAPTCVLASFDARYLQLPSEILLAVMRKHQRYLSLVDSDGKLLPHFIVVANGPCDTASVRAGNEAVVRARFDDAEFFFAADSALAPAEFHARLERLVFDERVGTMLSRAKRIDRLALALADEADVDPQSRKTILDAGSLAKFDQTTQMVTEFSSLSGVMAGHYAALAGLDAASALALAELELPTGASSEVARTEAGALLALADRFDLIVSLFAVGAKATGSTDQLGIRRAAIGAFRTMLAHRSLADLTISSCIDLAAKVVEEDGIKVPAEQVTHAKEFCVARLRQLLIDDGLEVIFVDLAVSQQVSPKKAVDLVETLVEGAANPGFRAMVAILDRIESLGAELPLATNAELLQLPAEQELLAALDTTIKEREASFAELPGYGEQLTPLVEKFFDEVHIMCDDRMLQQARLGLLGRIHRLAPTSVPWRNVHTAFRSMEGAPA